MEHEVAMRFFVPYKTFLLGEYAVLHTGRALLLATKPGFYYAIQICRQDTMQAAWPLLQQQLRLSTSCPITEVWRETCRKMPLQVTALTQSHKGFGSSGAQAWLALVYAYRAQYGRYPTKANDFLYTALQDYDDFVQARQGYSPSGGDMICQYVGQVTCMDKMARRHEAFSWPFSSMGFVLLYTGEKVLTHKHLQRVSVAKNVFTPLYEQGLEAFLSGDSAAFVEAFNQYQDSLVRQGLQLSSTTALLHTLRSIPGFVSGKGCGALGAEVVCVLYQQSYRAHFLTHMRKHFMVIATEADLSAGLRYAPALEKFL